MNLYNDENPDPSSPPALLYTALDPQAGGVEILECCQGMQKFSEALSAMFFLSFSKNWVPIGAFETLPFVRAPWKQGAMDKVELVELR
ncbi:hypothetical protein AXG93_1440s1150 [Marchantia polymorpha subsp. ruderalis]|uniref:Uncharacterized protein n=1 Tax=Marchantia polymorpha subsp. ruderalis TaxID=1480154 RepID=A0A176W204_MARPO|nr:hypothetical protein AXG93_1440s1150 [Marchantia polymorpha subsp. ruderalis]